MFIKWFLNILGILIYFFTKYDNRTDKSREPSRIFWIKDNWVRLSAILAFDIALMILIIVGGIQLNFEKIFPDISKWVTLTGDMAASFIVGLLLSWMIYEAYNKLFRKK